MKKFIYYSLLFLPILVLGQSTNQNYVKSTTYKTEKTSALPTSPAVTDGLVNITYFDGFGRPIQQIAHKQSGTGKDIVTHFEYDGYGRQVKEYLPFVSKGEMMIFDQDALNNTIDFYENDWATATSFPYSEKLFEPSPLNRVLKQGAPGEDWQIMPQYASDNTIKFNYSSNGEYEVKLLKVNTSTTVNANGFYSISLVNASGDVYYSPNELYKTITADENNAKTAEFKDKEGRVVLKKAFDYFDTNYDDMFSSSTYYVYDMYGNLTYVIPPKAVDLGTITPTVLNNLCYQYRYDARNRVVEKKLPGKAWEYIVYDKLDRVVATGPALTPFTDNPNQIGWLITKYDALGRVAYTGWNQVAGTFNSSTRNSLQGLVTNMNNVYVTSVNSSIDGVSTRYSNNSTVPVVSRLLTVNYYDNYSYPSAPTILPPFTISELGNAGDVTNEVKGLMTGSWVRVITTSSEKLFELTHMFYDKKGRPIRTYQQNHLGGFTQNDTQLDFIGNLLKVITTHKYDSTTAAVITVTEDFEYTPQGRLSEHKHKINNDVTETLSYNEYDELGQLDTKKVGRTASTPLQTVDYKYNIRGWLTDINDVDTLGDDLFAFKLNYNQIAHPYTTGGMPTPYYSSLYNGNVSETYWRTSNDNILRKYGYQYDRLSRLTNAYYIKPDVSSDNAMPRGNYNESVTYDKNGNITSIWRYGDLDSSIDRIVIDNLNYEYYGNRLIMVTDNSNHPEGFNNTVDEDDEFDYDDYGNLVWDAHKGITSITYNHLNLPKKITFNNSTQNISYLYNALGVKVEKKVYRPGTSGIFNTSYTITTNYLSGFHYEFYDNPNMISTSGNGLIFFATAEGYVNTILLRGGGYNYNYVYNYTDHLGNVRLSYTKGTGNNPPVILEENHYYPFGLKHKKYGSVEKDFVEIDDENGYYVGIDVVPPQRRKSYQFKFQSQEFQDELGLNWYSYKYRNYDPAIGRFMVIDPLTEEYHTWSPYVFSGNRVIDARELEGLEPYIVTGRTFIPNESLSNPNPFSSTKTFAGDNRNSYQVNTTAYRTEQQVRVDFENRKATTLSNTASSTTGYDKNGNVTAVSDPAKAGPTPTYTPNTMENGSTTVNMQVDASNKLVTGAPAINYDVNVTITETGNGTFDFNISGQSDGFPAYEFFITNEATGNSYLIYGSNPAATGDTPRALFPPMEKKINVSGNSGNLQSVEEVKFD